MSATSIHTKVNLVGFELTDSLHLSTKMVL